MYNVAIKKVFILLFAVLVIHVFPIESPNAACVSADNRCNGLFQLLASYCCCLLPKKRIKDYQGESSRLIVDAPAVEAQELKMPGIPLSNCAPTRRDNRLLECSDTDEESASVGTSDTIFEFIDYDGTDDLPLDM